MGSTRDVLADSSSDSESEDGSSRLRVNEDFAAEFAKREQKRLSARGKALGVEDSDGDESSSESEDEDAVELTRGMDVKILETINAIRRKDPKIYDKDAVFFDEAVTAEGGGGGGEKKKKKKKQQTFKDVARAQILAGGMAEEDDDGGAETPAGAHLAYDAEQRTLRASLLSAAAAADDSASEAEDDDLFQVRDRGAAASSDAEALEEEARLRRELEAFEASTKDAKKDAFLADFVAERRWAEAGSDDEDRHGGGVDLDADLEALDATDAFEAKYNFRFEQAGSSEIATHARDVVGSMRRKDESRKKKREERKERKAGERRRKEEELRRLKNLKKKELEAQLQKVVGVSGGASLDAAALEGDFDPEAYDAQMAATFGDDYYGGDDVEKPVFSDDDEKDEDEEDEDDEDEEEAGSASAAPRGALDEGQVLAAIKKKARDALDAMDHEDLIGDLPTRFKYATVPEADFGLSVDEILETPDAELQQLVSIKRIAPYRDREYVVSSNRRKKWRRDQAEKKAQRQADYEVARKKEKRLKKKRKDRGEDAQAADDGRQSADAEKKRTRKRKHKDGRNLEKQQDASAAKPANTSGVSRARMAAYGFT